MDMAERVEHNLWNHLDGRTPKASGSCLPNPRAIRSSSCLRRCSRSVVTAPGATKWFCAHVWFSRPTAFCNKRIETWWKLGETLSPEQASGSSIALPPDPQIRADLAAPRFRYTPRGPLLEQKAEIIKRLERSPDCGDAVVQWWERQWRELRKGPHRSLGGCVWLQVPSQTALPTQVRSCPRKRATALRANPLLEGHQALEVVRNPTPLTTHASSAPKYARVMH